jgi:hypothetical protein
VPPWTLTRWPRPELRAPAIHVPRLRSSRQASRLLVGQRSERTEFLAQCLSRVRLAVEGVNDPIGINEIEAHNLTGGRLEVRRRSRT